jgi:hypothetical protein
MSQSPRTCPVCGTSVPAGQRFCSNCGTNLETGQAAGQPPSQYGGSAPQSQQSYQQAPYAQQYGQQGQQFGQQQYGQQPMQPYQQPQKSNPIAEALGALGLLFFMRRFRPGYRPRRQSSGCCGCLVLLIILGIIFGIPAYVYYKAHPSFIQQIQNQIQHTNNNRSDRSGTLPTSQPPITTVATGQTVNYTGVDLTFVDVKQSTTFLDDTSATTNGMIRLDFKESAGQQTGIYSYSQVFRLILPDGTTVSPLAEEYDGGPQSDSSRNNWADFQVPTSIKPDQIQLAVGTPQDAQIQFFLTSKVDPKYLPRTSSPNATFTYAGIQWTLTKAAIGYSVEGKQATPGNIYVTISLRAVNNSSNNFIENTDSYMRLQAGSALNPPVDNGTLTNSFQPSSTNSGDVSFLVPQGNTSFTLNMLALSNTPPIAQVSQNFQV